MDKNYKSKATDNTAHFKANGFLRNAHRAVINTTSDILSFGKRRRAGNAIRQSDAIIKDIKTVRANPGFDANQSDYRDPVFRARANVIGFKGQQEKLANKLKK